ncbi:MAG: GntR family transcriptional regulator [Nocardioides sp.]
MRITVDSTRLEAPYDQVRRQITALVDRGTLAPGERLPTVRALAEELGLAANTVARAYRELESRGVVATRGRSGTFVSGDAVQRAAREAATLYAAQVRDLGLSRAEAVALVERSLDQNGSA